MIALLKRYTLLLIASFLLINACESKKEENTSLQKKTLFEEISAEKTGITFSNTVIQEGENNVLNYPYYFNGGGVAVGDINNDGWPDVYFSGNKVANQLYLNKGRVELDSSRTVPFQFENITQKAGVAAAEGWKTGVTMADVNQDGWLDIYVCRSAMGDSLLRKNLLFINNHDLTFTEQAEEYGLANTGYSTQAAFFDYDNDNDLDLFVLNHSLPKYAGFSKLLEVYKQEKNSKFASQLYQNDQGKFTNVTEKAGITNNVLSFGLGVAVSDVNSDGWPDLYISNDFNEEDYLFLNNRNGTFKNVIRESTGHTSLFSMGSDIADINNDGQPDIFTLDMLPETNERIKLSSGDDNYDKYRRLLNAGFHHQTMRNMLQLNQGNNAAGVPSFSEVGQLSGISNTDWSWTALFADFDGDGWKDLFISNGYEKDYTNMQFLKFTVDERVKARETGVQPSMQQILDQMPSIQVGNYFFKNEGKNLAFTKKSTEWGISRTFKSNGAAYADLDKDGDLDLLVNTLNEPAVVYQNKAVEEYKAHFLKINLPSKNPKQVIIGTKVWVYIGQQVQYQEFSPVRGFQSSMYGTLSFGTQQASKVDSVKIVYPDSKTQWFKNVPVAQVLTPEYEKATEIYGHTKQAKPVFLVTQFPGWLHTPADTNDFKRQLLLPYQYSYSGPKMAAGDINQDGRMDFYVCGPKGQAGALWIQKANATFQLFRSKVFEADKQCQDEDATFLDADNDGDLDLYVVSGGYSFNETDPMLQDRLYLNDGKGNFVKSSNSLPAETLAGSCVASFDFDGDNDLDLFVGTRFIPGQYPLSSKSLLLINDGKGHFAESYVPAFQNLGMVCDVQSADVNGDKKVDLIITGEWMPISIFFNDGKGFSKPNAALENTTGWWNSLLAEDFDKDGDIDLVAGNYGLNTQFKASTAKPVTLTYKDFDQNGQVDPFLSYYIGDTSYPYASRDEALGQVTFLKKRYADYTTYANATLAQMFTAEEMKESTTLKATEMKTIYLENQAGKFVPRALPIQMQFSPIFSLLAFDFDKDGDKDLIAGGNLTQSRVRVGKTDANYLQVFENKAGVFTYKADIGIKGDIRDLILIDDSKIAVGVNNSPLFLLQTQNRPNPIMGK
jgi:hypothetical protein